jgi:sugar transferase (PEP-CTERM/EpsH1 system associated)
MKIRILHIVHSLQIGGLENGVVNLINNLNSDRFEHTICCIDSSGPMADRIRRPVDIYTLKKGDKRDYLLPVKISRIIRNVRPDVVHTRNWGTIDGVAGAKIAGVKNIIHGEHGWEASDPRGANNRRKRVRKLLSTWISHFVAVSDDLRSWLIDDVGISSAKVTQIINGVDTHRYSPSKERQSIKERLGIMPDYFVIGTVGRLDPVKDHETLLRAFQCALIRSENRKLVLIIVGTGPLETRLKVLSKELNISENIRFVGQQDDMQSLYQSMDIYVLPSIAEGISNTMLEAMASGLPVVASAVGGSVELIEDGKTGFLFNPGDYRLLTAKLSIYLGNASILQEHGTNGRKRALELFSLSKMVKEYERLYCSTLNYPTIGVA